MQVIVLGEETVRAREAGEAFLLDYTWKGVYIPGAGSQALPGLIVGRGLLTSRLKWKRKVSLRSLRLVPQMVLIFPFSAPSVLLTRF